MRKQSARPRKKHLCKMEIMKLPGFPRYGLNESGEPCSERRNGEWVALRGDIYSIRNESFITTIKRAKFVFCVNKQIDPRKFKSRGYCISRTGDLLTYSEKNTLKAAAKRNTGNSQDGLDAVRKEIRWLVAAEQFYLGHCESLLSMLQEYRPLLVNYLRKTHVRNKSFIESVVEKAELQLVDAMGRGHVRNPQRWVLKRACGIIIEEKKHLCLFRDFEVHENAV